MDIELSLTAIRGADNERTTRKEKGTARKVSKQRISLIIYHSTEAERFYSGLIISGLGFEHCLLSTSHLKISRVWPYLSRESRGRL